MIHVFNEILGKEIQISEHPERIVSLSPAITESLFMMGLGDRVIGVSAFCARPEEAKEKRRKVGSYNSVNFEVLEQLRPDLILTVTGYQRPLALNIAEKFPTYPVQLPVSVAGIIDTVVKVGLVLGEENRGWKLSSELHNSLSQIKPIDKDIRTYVEIDLGGAVSFGAYSYITDALRLLGATNVFDHVRVEWLTPDLDNIPDLNPDAFFYEAKMYSKFNEQQLESLIDKRGWRMRMKAVKNKNYFLTPGPLDFLAHHGPSFITDVLPWLNQRLASIADQRGNVSK